MTGEYGGVSWERLGVYTLRNGTISVQLTDNASGNVVADAIAIVPVTEPPDGEGSDAGAGSSPLPANGQHPPESLGSTDIPQTPRHRSTLQQPLLDALSHTPEPSLLPTGWARQSVGVYLLPLVRAEVELLELDRCGFGHLRRPFFLVVFFAGFAVSVTFSGRALG